MNRIAIGASVAIVLMAFSGCFLQNPLSGAADGGAALLPPDQVNDTTRSYTDPFEFRTVLPVGLELRVDLYASSPGAKGLAAPESLPAGSAAVIVTLRDSKGNLVYEGLVQEDGTLSTVLSLPAAPEDMTLLLQAEGFESRQVLIRDMRAYAEVNRIMSMLSDGVGSKDATLGDLDGDGVVDGEDAYPEDPRRAFLIRIPASESFSIAFEDLFGHAMAGDADYNDFIAHYYVYEVLNSANQVVEIAGHAEAVTKIAGYNHDFGLVIDGITGAACLTTDYFDKNGGKIYSRRTAVDKGYANIQLFSSTKDAVERTTEFTLTFEQPQYREKVIEELVEKTLAEEKLSLDQAPYNPYLYVRDTRVFIHMIGEKGLPALEYTTHNFVDEDGFPWALLVPVDWRHPEETQRIEIPYPRFTLWRLSGGKEHTDWYLHYDDPYEPPTGPQTTMAANINTRDRAGSDPAFLFVFKNAVYFRANDGSTGAELWRYDSSGALRVADINSGSADGLHPTSRFDFFAEFNDVLYFRASGGADNYELWRYSGTGSPTQIPFEINPNGSSFPIYPRVFGSRLYFGAQNGINGYELWAFDGINRPTMIRDINPAGSSTPSYLTVFDDVLYFQADGGEGNTELWQYDGTALPSLVDEINPDGGSAPQFLTVFKGKLYFKADNGEDGFELWEYDGDNRPAMIVPQIYPNSGNADPSYLTEFQGKLYFQADGGSGHGSELWAYDGTNPPLEAADINPSGDSSPAYLCVLDDRLYFRADGGTNGAELWSYDGVNAPAEVADIHPSGDSNPAFLTALGSRLYFAADDGVNGRELWVHDPGAP